MRRAATFVWTLSRPTVERNATSAFIIKVDRNGQTFLPDDPALFETVRSLLTPGVSDAEEKE